MRVCAWCVVCAGVCVCASSHTLERVREARTPRQAPKRQGGKSRQAPKQQVDKAQSPQPEEPRFIDHEGYATPEHPMIIASPPSKGANPQQPEQSVGSRPQTPSTPRPISKPQPPSKKWVTLTGSSQSAPTGGKTGAVEAPQQQPHSGSIAPKSGTPLRRRGRKKH